MCFKSCIIHLIKLLLKIFFFVIIAADDIILSFEFLSFEAYIAFVLFDSNIYYESVFIYVLLTI